ncbi:hypothetical protein C2857_004511 [Epichloe festucae Fl1]|uniref:Uncharacterized protein n=1 Tax=Epichloe festucae (strain Fl1) TaxID=877507 RepID=A0A7S9KSD0_EPIFF|nr:hypothetical protein C2857_004511 [Epichloe festucae Fl1]
MASSFTSCVPVETRPISSGRTTHGRHHTSLTCATLAGTQAGVPHLQEKTYRNHLPWSSLTF